jgi:hypothetical protein
MNENEQYFLALKEFYDEVALIDFNAKTCHVLSGQNMLLYETDAFDVECLLIAKKHKGKNKAVFFSKFLGKPALFKETGCP